MGSAQPPAAHGAARQRGSQELCLLVGLVMMAPFLT